MNWNDVKRVYSSQWVLIRSYSSKNEMTKRIIEKMDVLEGFGENGERAFQRYIELHKLHKEREYYVYHTSHEILDIGVKKWMGVRL